MLHRMVFLGWLVHEKIASFFKITDSFNVSYTGKMDNEVAVLYLEIKKKC